MVQEIIVWLLFSGALFYLGFTFYKQKNAKDGDMPPGCAGCAKMDAIKSETQGKS